MARQVTVDLVGDTRDFQRGMEQASRSADGFTGSIQKAESQAKDLGSRIDGVGSAIDDSERKIMGTADLLDGLATTMGLNVGAAVQLSRGFADIASGLYQAVIPSLKAFIAGMNRSRVAIIGAVTALVAVASTSPTVRSTIGDLTALFKEGIGIVDDWARGLFGGKSALERFNESMEVTVFGIDDVAKAMESVSSQTLTLGQFAQSQRLILDDLANSYGDLGDRIHGAAVQLYELYKRQGIFLSQAAGMRLLGIEGPISQSNQSNPFMPMEPPPATAARAKRTAKAVSSGIDEVAKAATAAFQKVLPKLQAASKRFEEAVSLRDTIRNLFQFNFADDIGHNVTETLSRQVKRFEDFAKAIAKARKNGLRESLVRQFAQAGPGSLDELNRVNASSVRDVNRLVDRGNRAAADFANAEAKRVTGTDPTRDVKVTLDVRGADRELVNLIKKWVRVDGGGNVQVAFGGK